MGKGSQHRPENRERYERGWERAFRKPYKTIWGMPEDGVVGARWIIENVYGPNGVLYGQSCRPINNDERTVAVLQ